MMRIGVLHVACCLLTGSIVLGADPSYSLAQQMRASPQEHDAGAQSSESPKTESSSAPPANTASDARTTVENSKVPLSEFGWLDGKWQGNWGPRVAEQVWMGPRAGEMPGFFRLAENDKTLVLELFSLFETADGIELRLRHFTPSLVPWEQSSMAILKLAAADAKQAVFENGSGGQPGRLTLIRIDADTYVSRTEITSTSENKQITEIRYHKVKSPLEEAPSQKKKKP